MSELMTRRNAIKVTALTLAGFALWPRQALATVRQYAIVYKLRGGKNPFGQLRAITAGKKMSTSKLRRPTRKGYSFKGWYKDKKRRHKARTVYGRKKLASRRVYAEWSAIRYQIHLHLNGGTRAKGQARTYTISRGAALKTPTKPAYQFKGWYADKRFKKRIRSIKKGSTGTKRAYAKWVFAKYWSKEISAKSKTAKQLARQVGSHGGQFIFITDVHWGRNVKASPIVINRILKKTGIKRVFCGGDVIDRHLSSHSEALNTLHEFRKGIDTKKVYLVRGNHDGNSEDNPKKSKHVTNAELASIFLKPAGMKPEGKGQFPLYYGFDDKESRVRYLVLDTGHPHTAVMGDDQVEWLKKNVLEAGSGWTVLIFMHQLFSSLTGYDKNGKLVKAALDEVYDQAGATIAGVISGHLHADRHEYSEKGYPLICTTCDASKRKVAKLHGLAGPSRKAGTKREQAFDIVTIDTQARKLHFTRVGWGKSRAFEY